MAFRIEKPDEASSPFTGMTRAHWLDAARFLLQGVFRHVKDFDDPIAFPKQPGKTYPQADDPEYKFRAAEFEGLARTFMIASFVIADDPGIELEGKRLRDYYANQILRATDPASPVFWGLVTDMQKQYGLPLFQHTAEGAALALGLRYSRDAIWDRFSKAERDQVARVLSDYVHSRTNSHNWRWFNIIMGTLLRLEGYDVDEVLLKDHLDNVLAAYAGDGWYRDIGTFDFYSCWAYQFYAPLWTDWYGYENEPGIARVIGGRHNELMRHYPLMFSRRGHSLMWGRSIMYRCAASAPFGVHFLLRNPAMDPGWARRIASGNLLQFLTREDVFMPPGPGEGLPTLGFYRTFEPLVQGYSCAASPFWLGKTFLALANPPDSPFWTATENEGEWPEIGRATKAVSLDGPGLYVFSHGATGESELLPGKVASKGSNPNYTRLAYNTGFVWESDATDSPTAMAYAVRERGTDEWFPNMGLMYAGRRGGVLYRQADLRGWQSKVELADVPVRFGTLRVDRVRIPYAHDLCLAHYGLPHVAGAKAKVHMRERRGTSGISCSIPGRRVAMVSYGGWEELGSCPHHDLNAEAPESTVIFMRTSRDADYRGAYLCVTLMLHRTDDGEWTEDELDPAAAIEPVALSPSGSPCGLRLGLRDGREFEIDFGDIEGLVQQ